MYSYTSTSSSCFCVLAIMTTFLPVDMINLIASKGKFMSLPKEFSGAYLSEICQLVHVHLFAHVCLQSHAISQSLIACPLLSCSTSCIQWQSSAGLCIYSRPPNGTNGSRNMILPLAVLVCMESSSPCMHVKLKCMYYGNDVIYNLYSRVLYIGILLLCIIHWRMWMPASCYEYRHVLDQISSSH